MQNSLIKSIKKSFSYLEFIQEEDGCWEGEMIWCPMITAQYTIVSYIIGVKISQQKKKNLFNILKIIKMLMEVGDFMTNQKAICLLQL